MASTNKNLHNAKKEKDDEYYTILSDIESELSYYSSHLKDKTILCNCNDSPQSAFYQYFMRNFEKLHLKKLITIYPSHKFTYDGTTIMDTYLNNDGDFRKNEDTLQEADIIITNPPFSLFREYITQLFKYNKNFLIIGNKNSVKYKEIFPYIKNNLLWLGYTSPIKFNTPEGETNKLQGLCRWFTNLPVEPKHLPNTNIKFSNMHYDTYDNLPDIIKINTLKEIPMDYENYMAVPITFLDHYNSNEYEIIELLNRYSVLDYFKINEKIKKNHSHCCNVNGNATFSRIIIKKYHPEMGGITII